MWYAEKDFEAIDIDKRSLVIASANLTQKFDKQIDPVDFYAALTQEDTDIDWWNVAEYIDGIDIGRVVEDGSWPDSSLAIVKFRRLDEKAAGLVDHYCLVADHRAHSIVDSLDATIKSAVEYGEVLGWASYVREADPEVVVNEEIAEIDAALIEYGLSASKTVYVLGKDETIWDVSRTLSIPVNKLIEFNELGDPRYLQEGHTLRIPLPAEKDDREVMYELLDEPRLMHVSAPTGTTKFSFGNATKWSDIKPTARRYAFGQSIIVSAIAHVPLTDEVESAKYYMEAVDVGTSPTTDHVRYTVGFSHAHMKEGPYVAPEPPKVVKPAMTAKPTPTPLPEPPAFSESWKDTHQPLNDDLSPELYLMDESLIVHDIAHKHPPRTVEKLRGVRIYSTFQKDGVLYGRPMQSARQGSWYGIPMDKMTAEKEVYSINVSLAEKVALHGKLTLQERGVVYLSRLISEGTKIKTIIKRHK